jgi:hypothetical protein
MTNQELELTVADELAWDPKVDSGTIAVSADGGYVATCCRPSCSTPWCRAPSTRPSRTAS